MRAAFEIGAEPSSSARARRLLRSYGLLLLLAIAFLVMVLSVPTADRTVPAETPGPAQSLGGVPTSTDVWP